MREIRYEMEEQRLNYIHEIGLFFDRLGVARTAGMVLGYLMSASESEISFDTIRKDLRISKGAASQNLKWLAENGFVEKCLKPGDRKTYYRFKIMAAEVLLEERILVINRLVELFGKGIEIRGATGDAAQRELEKAIDTYSWIVLNMKKMKEELRKSGPV